VQDPDEAVAELAQGGLVPPPRRGLDRSRRQLRVIPAAHRTPASAAGRRGGGCVREIAPSDLRPSDDLGSCDETDPWIFAVGPHAEWNVPDQPVACVAYRRTCAAAMLAITIGSGVMAIWAGMRIREPFMPARAVSAQLRQPWRGEAAPTTRIGHCANRTMFDTQTPVTTPPRAIGREDRSSAVAHRPPRVESAGIARATPTAPSKIALRPQHRLGAAADA
jgi:hypothetical protein